MEAANPIQSTDLQKALSVQQHWATPKAMWRVQWASLCSIACHFLYNSHGCANRSCGPPKPGRLLLNGVRPCRRGPVPDGPSEGPWGCRRVPYGSVHQSCTDTGQSSDPSSPVGCRRAKTWFRWKPVGNRYGLRGPDGPRRITRLTCIGVRLIYGPIPDHTGP